MKAWLGDHGSGQPPGIELVTRGHSRAYANTITNACPNIVQVADRWQDHRAKLSEAVERFLDT